MRSSGNEKPNIHNWAGANIKLIWWSVAFRALLIKRQVPRPCVMNARNNTTGITQGNRRLQLIRPRLHIYVVCLILQQDAITILVDTCTYVALVTDKVTRHRTAIAEQRSRYPQHPNQEHNCQ